MRPHNERFEVFFDGKCPLCRREIEMVRRKDTNHQLLLTDISVAGFDTSQLAKSLDELMREIHGRDGRGEWFVGVEVFREMYSRIGFKKLSGLVDWPMIRQLLELGYRGFAYFRYRSAVARVRRETGAEFACESTCAPLSASNTEGQK